MTRLPRVKRHCRSAVYFGLLSAFVLLITACTQHADIGRLAATQTGTAARTPFQPVYAVGWDTPGIAQPSAHLALVIGNDNYSGAERLGRARQDAELVAAALQHAGFTLIGGTAHLDADTATMQQLFTQLESAAAARPNALTVIYFAGHGAVDATHNLLLPVDVSPAADRIARRQRGISANEVAARLSQARVALNVMFLDNCRKLQAAGSGGFVPIEVPDRTFMGFSTNLAGVAVDEDSSYARALAQEIREGFATLAEMHLRIGGAVANRSILQFPVFSVGASMSPAQSFYPASHRMPPPSGRQAFEAMPVRAWHDECAARSRWSVVARQVVSRAVAPPFAVACQRAWDEGWRSREVMRGLGIAHAFRQTPETTRASSRGSYFMNWGEVLFRQAAELGDPTAALFLYFRTVPGVPRLADNAMPTGIGEFLLLERGVTLGGFSINNINDLRIYAIRRILNGDDERIVFDVAAELAGIQITNRRGSIIESTLREPMIPNLPTIIPGRSNREVGQQKLIEQAQRGFGPAVAYILGRFEEGETWTRGLSFRRFMTEALRHDNFEMEGGAWMFVQGLDARTYIQKSLIVDLYLGTFGPRDAQSAVDLAIIVERKSACLQSFNRIDGPQMSFRLGSALMQGMTTAGERIRRDRPSAIRFLRCAAAGGIPEGRQALERIGVQ